MIAAMTTAGWAGLWWWWLFAVLASWLVMELTAIVVAKLHGERNIQEWTLSDTIRRWSAAHRWLAPLVCGATIGLLVHFFGMGNAG